MSPIERSAEGAWTLDGETLREGELVQCEVGGAVYFGRLEIRRGLAWIVSRRDDVISETRVRVGLAARRASRRAA